MNSAAAHLATREQAGLFDFSFMTLYEFSGLQALQGLQSRRLRELEPGRIVYTLLLKDDGAVLIDATVWRLAEERYWLFTGKPVAVPGRLRSGEHAILALQGPQSGAILARLLGRDAVERLKYFRFCAAAGITVARLGFSGELGYELLVPARDGPLLRQRLVGLGVPECSWAAADSLRIESGYVLFDRELDGRANPRELGLAQFVDSQPSFPLRRKLVGLEVLQGEPAAGLPRAAVTSECLSPTLGKTIALAWADPRSASPGSLVRLADGRAARVARLPFYDPERRRPRAAPL